MLKLYRKAKTAPTNFGAMWGLMENEKAVLQVAAESLVHVISHSMDGRKRNSIAAEVGKRAEFVLWLNHPMWKGSLHLKWFAPGQWPHAGHVVDAQTADRQGV